MSIRIGTGSTVASTTNERINLVTTQPDAIVVVSCNVSTIPTNMVFNTTSRFGNCNNTFYMSECNVPYFTVSSNAMSMFGTFAAGPSNIALQGNASISSNLTSGSLLTSNIVTSNLIASTNVTAGSISTNNIAYLNTNILAFANNGSNNSVIIDADATITGKLSLLQKLVIDSAQIGNLSFPSLSFPSPPNNYSSNILNVQSSSNTAFTCNLVNVALDNSPAFIINNQGQIGINTGVPSAYLQLQSFPPNPNPDVIQSNLFAVISPSNTFVIDNNAMIGIGTTDNLTHQLHMYSCNTTVNPNPSSLIGIYMTAAPGLQTAPILSAYDNGIPAVFISPEGNVVLGNGSYDSAYTLNVQGRTTTSTLVTNSMVSTNAGATPIDVGYSSLSNINVISTNSCSINTGAFSNVYSLAVNTSNFVVPNVATLSPTQAEFDSPSVLFTGPNVTMGTVNDSINLAPEIGGRLFVVAPGTVSGQTSIAMAVVGNDTGRNVIRVVSTKPALELFATPSHGYDQTIPFPKAGVCIDSANGMYLSYTSTSSTDLTSTPKQLIINDNGISLARSIQIATADSGSTLQGYMGLCLPSPTPNNPTLPLHTLHMDGSLWVQSSNNSPASTTTAPYFYINEASGNIGIRTNAPQRSLHVNGSLYAQTVETTLPVITSSDSNLKTDLVPIADALKKVRSLTGYTFTRTGTDLGSSRETGLIAQEVQKILPEAVAASDQYLGIAYGNLAGLFVEAIKAMSDRIETLESKLAALSDPTS